MHKLGRGHRDKIQQFVTVTGASEKVALQALKASDWHLDGALDVDYSQSQIRTFTDTSHLEELYKRYKEVQIQHLAAPKKLTIEHFKQVVALPQWVLEIYLCLKLQERCAKKRGSEWSKISHIPDIISK